MAFPDLTGILALIGEICQDTSSVNAGTSGTIRTDLFNEKYHAWKAQSEARVLSVAGAATWGASVSGTRSRVSASIDWVDVLRVFRETSNADIGVGPQLERISVPQILALQNAAGATVGPPTMCSLERRNTQASQADREWLMRLYPICDGAYYFSSQVVAEPTALSSGGDVPDLTREECYAITRATAAECAGLLGRDQQFVENIWRTVPQRFAEVLRRSENAVSRNDRRAGLPS